MPRRSRGPLARPQSALRARAAPLPSDRGKIPKKSKQNKETVGGEARFSSHRTRLVASFPPRPKLLKQLRRGPPGKRPQYPAKAAASWGGGSGRHVSPGVGVGGREDSRERPSAALGARRWESGLPPRAGGEAGGGSGRGVVPARAGAGPGRGRGRRRGPGRGGRRGLALLLFLLVAAGCQVFFEEGRRGECPPPGSGAFTLCRRPRAPLLLPSRSGPGGRGPALVPSGLSA